MWFIGVEEEQETSAPPPKKNAGSAPVPYACPLIIFVLYFSIGVKLWRRLVKTQASSFVNSHSRKRMTVEVSKMLIVSVVVFAFCWLPQHVALLINNFMIDICLPELLWFG